MAASTAALAVVVDQRQQGLGQPGHVPLHDRRLVAVGVAAAVVDGAEHRGRVIGVHERARAVVDRLAGDRGVVGVHDPVHEPGQQPLSYQCCLRPGHPPQQFEVAVRGACGLRVVAVDGEVRQRAQSVRAAGGGSVLERAHPQVARGDPGEDRTRQRPLAHHPLTGGDDRERPRGGDSQAVHGLTDQVLAQHRAHRGLAVAAARERGAPRPFQVQVTAAAMNVGHLAEQQRPAVPQPGHVDAELVTGVGLGDRRDTGSVPHQQQHTRPLPQRRGVGAQLHRQRLVEHQQLRSVHRCRRPRHRQARHLAGVGIIEPEQRRRHSHASRLRTAAGATPGHLPP